MYFLTIYSWRIQRGAQGAQAPPLVPNIRLAKLFFFQYLHVHSNILPILNRQIYESLDTVDIYSTLLSLNFKVRYANLKVGGARKLTDYY